ncbi:MAG: hypothetical protein AUG49_04400 [Catenulispora sp. 13_1_20CM_3_70_7]|nr:MAG: hypothetical protein AUG49_04400 [Catenulispora sp. 13_1_20CM_3_70_7]
MSVTWDTFMGMRYPTVGEYGPPVPDLGARSPGSAALEEAGRAYRVALETAVTRAVALAAGRALDAEVIQTRRTVRGIVSGRVPRLEDGVREHTARLEEAERADLIRLRWAAGRIDAG